MRTHSFTLFLTGDDVLTDEAQNALHQAGCDDALFGERDGAQYAAFDRDASSFGHALRTALRDLRRSDLNLHVVRLEPDQLVSMAAIAERSGLSREYVRLLMSGDRGPGGFPAPVAHVDHKTRLWHWPDVADWLAEYGKGKAEVDKQAADLVIAYNAAVDLREHTRSLPKRDLALVAEALGDHPLIRG